MMDALLEMPMAEVLEKVPLDRETKAVLLGRKEWAVTVVPVDAGT
jgi:hypothetical protein